jgi:PAS domain S-box-containing protein
MSDAVQRGLVEDVLAVSTTGMALLAEGTHDRVNGPYAAALGADSPEDLTGTDWRDRFSDPAVERIEAAIDDPDSGTATLEAVTCETVDGERFRSDLRVRGTGEGAVLVLDDRVGRAGPNSSGGGESDAGIGRFGIDEGGESGGDPDGDAGGQWLRSTDGHDHRRLLEAASVPVGIVTPDLELAYCNDPAADFFDAESPSVLEGRSVETLVTEDEREPGVAVLRATIANGEVREPAEWRFLTLQGEERIALVSATPVSYNGRSAAQVVLNDVTAKRRMGDRFERLVEAAPVPITVVTGDGTIAYCNRATAEFHSADDPAELIGRPRPELMAEDSDLEAARDRVRRVIEDDEVISAVERRYRRLDGGERVGVGSLAPITYDGEAAVMVVINDVTDRKRREQELRRRERRYRTLAENLPNGSVALFQPTGDGDIEYTLVAGSLFEHLELDAEEMEGRRFSEFHSEGFLEGHRSKYRAALEGETNSFEFTYEGRTFRAHALPVDAERDPPVGIAMSQDVTERRDRERELRRQKRRYRTLAENIPDGAVALFEEDEEGALRYTVIEGPIFDEIEQDRDTAVGQRLTDYHSDWFVDRFLQHHEAALEGETSTFQYTSFDRVFRAYTVPITDETGEVVSGMVMAQDVTEREERKRRLETLIDTLPGIAYRCRNDPDWPMEFVGGECEATTGYTAEQLERGEVLWGPDVIHPEDREDAWEIVQAAIEAGEPFELTYRILTSDDEVRWMWERGQAVYDADGELVALEGFITDITDRRENERELARRRDELETLNQINGLLLNITRALSDVPTCEDVESIVCERLAASELYRFAWIGERAIDEDAIVPRTSAGVEEGYLEAVSATAGGNVPDGGPAGRALQTGEVQVVQDVRSDESFEPWRDAAVARGYRSAAAVPLVHGETVYGLLAVYSARQDAFSDREQSAFATLGETIGFVINALQNRRLLVADDVTELAFEGSDPDVPPVAASEHLDATVSLEGYAETAGDDWLVYLSIDGGDPDDLVTFLLERDGVSDAWVIEATDAGGQVGVREPEPWFVRSLLSAGATLQEATATDGTLRAVLEVPGSADVRSVVDLLRDAYPSIELVAQRELDRPVRTAAEFRESFEECLTERQLAALRAAYYAGYFDWPRGSTAEDIADSMGIASATLHNHLRKANRQLLSLLFDESESA